MSITSSPSDSPYSFRHEYVARLSTHDHSSIQSSCQFQAWLHCTPGDPMSSFIRVARLSTHDHSSIQSSCQFQAWRIAPPETPCPSLHSSSSPFNLPRVYGVFVALDSWVADSITAGRPSMTTVSYTVRRKSLFECCWLG